MIELLAEILTYLSNLFKFSENKKIKQTKTKHHAWFLLFLLAQLCGQGFENLAI